MSSAAYTVKTPIFEGPLELLLTLIEKRKLFVNDIALAEVADDFIAYLKSHPDIPVEEASEFVMIASALVLIKSKSLLPNMKLTHEEEESIGNLEQRLRTYERFKQLSLSIQSLFGHNRIFAPDQKIPSIKVFAPSPDMDVSHLHGAIWDIIGNLPRPEKNPEITVKKIISLEEMMQKLSGRIERAMKLSFKEFSGDSSERVHVIVSFLALLELIKQGEVDAEQHNEFEDISIESHTITTPKYL